MRKVYKHKIKSGTRTFRFLTAFVLFVSLHILGSAEARHSSVRTIVSNDSFNSTLHSATQANDFAKRSHSYPLEPIPLPSQEKDTDNKENIEEDDWTDWQSLTASSHGYVDTGYSIPRTVHFLKSMAHRERKALFVLHCSWRNYLSH